MLHRGICLATFVFVLFLPFCSAVAADHFPDCLARQLRTIHANIYNEHFAAADSMVDELLSHQSSCPIGWLYRAVVTQGKMIAQETTAPKDHFFEALDSAETIGKHMLEVGEDSALAYFLLGNKHALRALYASRNESMLKALKEGLAAKSAFSDGYKLDPHFYDLALGLGTYRYWKSVKTDFINWTPLFRDERSDGIRLLRLAADSAEVTAEGARAALVHVYINEKLYGQALQLADDLRRTYPDGLIFVWPMAQIYFELHDYQAAAREFELILARQRRHPGNYYNYIEAAYYLSQCWRKLDMDDSLRTLQDEISALTVPPETVERQDDKLRKILNN